MKTYICTVMGGNGNKLMEARGRRGLRALVEGAGLSYDGLRGFYADRGQPAQIKVEWSENGEWKDDAMTRARLAFITPVQP